MIERGKISASQMAIMMNQAILATVLLLVPAISAKHAKQDIWLSPIWASLIGFLAVFLAYKLNKLYPKETLIEYCELILGKVLGKIIGAVYLFFYLHITGIIVREYGEFVSGNFLPHTPMLFIFGTMVLLCSLAVYGGLEVIGRCAEIILPVILVFYLIMCIMLFKDLDIKNMFPIMESIDKISNKTIELSVLVYVPKGQSSQQGSQGGGGGGSGAGSPQTLVRSAKGITIADAMAKLQEKLPRHIFWGHSEVFIFNRELAMDGIADHIDFILRHPQLRERSQLFISKQKAKKVLGLIPPLERDLSAVLRELETEKMGIEVTTKNFAQMLISDSGDTAVPWITILPPEEGKKKKESSAYIAGTAIFKKDKMVGTVNDSVTRGVMWLRNEIQPGIITVKPKEDKGYVSMNLLQAQSELIPRIEHGKWIVTLKAEAEADIVQNTTSLDMANPLVTKSLEQQLKKEIGNKVNIALVKVQKNKKADIFGFGDAFHRKYPELWKREKGRWDEIYPKVEVTIDVRTNIRRPGSNSVLSTILRKR